MVDASYLFDRQTDCSFQLDRADEETVADGRSSMTPSQHVEQKLMGILGSAPLPVSQAQRWAKRRPR